MAVDVAATLGQLVVDDQRRARVMETLGLDYCCNGQRPLSAAIADAGLDPDVVVRELDLPDAGAQQAKRPSENAELAHDIVDTHHAYMWAEMPRLQALVDKVHGVHGPAHPELAEIRAAFHEAVAELDPHMTTEERIVFPAISKMEKTRAASGVVAPRVEQLRAEHDVVGALFKQIRKLTEGFSVPGDACASYRAMLTGLEEMELDLHEHIHLENNVLFPRAVALEERLTAGQDA